MMGTKIRNFAPLPNLSLEELVPKENFYRRLDRKLDLSFVRDIVEDRYACSGRPSVDPVVFFRLQLVMFFEDIRSERRLMEVAADRLSIRWFLGYDLNEPLPDHSSLTRIRERYGLEIFRRFFERIVEECFEAGLVWGKELYFDATKVEANASFDSMGPRLVAVEDRIEEHLADIFPEAVRTVQAGSESEIAIMGPAGLEREALAQTNASRHRWIAKCGRQQREVVRWGYTRIADLRVSATDPDASPMQHKKKGSSRLGYLTHYVVDGGKARVILDALVTPAEVTENLPMLELLFRSRFRWRLRPHSVTGDAAYGTVENVAAVEKAGIRAYIVLPNHDERGPLLSMNEFVYDAEKDLYICLQGETLRRQGHDYKERSIRYAARPSACNVCPLKCRCTKSKKGRWIRRSFEEEYLERVRGYRDTEPYRKALRKRQVWVEPLFGEAKDWHGSRRFRLRRLEKVNSEVLLIAAGQNTKGLLTYGHRGPKRPAQVAALRPPAPNPYKFYGVRRHRDRGSRRPARVFQHPGWLLGNQVS
ncbi:MAG: IS1182 family transposase [Actinobacteria bacterium]|nr:IS1182 family transposase [Actinomycetota bacterium]